MITITIILFLIAMCPAVYSYSDCLCFDYEEEVNGSSKIAWPNNDKALELVFRMNKFPSNVKFHFRSSEKPQTRDLDIHLGIKKPYYQVRHNLTHWDYKTYFSKMNQVKTLSIVRERKGPIAFKAIINGKETKFYGRKEGYAYVTTEGLNDVIFRYSYQN